MVTSFDDPVWASLTGLHAPFAEGLGQVLRYQVDVAPFFALSPESDDGVWADVAALAGPGATVTVHTSLPAPPEWEVVGRIAGVRLVDVALEAAEDPEAVLLGPDDVPEMLDLVERTKPGPFRKRTVELGTYLGIRRDGALIAMAGERLHPPGWTEISAVCTDPAHRGQGLATRLIRAVAAGIRARGETPMMHAAATNTSAIRLYQSIGFELVPRPDFVSVRVPETSAVTGPARDTGSLPAGGRVR
ncbi:GNAT family N-acetyltransferase [Amycolatopsis azurea]|uniref:GNAT family N-acetyltransferase n=1 Tax=Amycolatopsis azurea DSM 43854 TaxID=1238180 RepID=A0ABX3JG37_9PSEU|nr:GNAT family N-acetyltransferase [Amycolatopsis azurea]OOC06660.1 GNAT family N-acetyltransferase [Amycolatopsis azurea DSM 43854]